MDWFPPHNLIESEALALQGGELPSYGLTNGEEAIRPLQVNEIHRPVEAWTSEFTSGSYVVEFGRHKLVVLNTKYDNGIPNDWEDVLSQKLPQPNVGTKKLLAGGCGPDSVGFETEEKVPQLLRKAIAELGRRGRDCGDPLPAVPC